MKITSLLVENFRAVKRVALEDLGEMVVIAGPNGCGKTQLYHAIGLLKSTYGGYQENEYRQWWGEFKIDLNRPGKDIFAVFRDRSRPLRVRATFEVTREELEFLLERAEALVRARIWQDVMPGREFSRVTRQAAFAQAQRLHGAEVEERTEQELEGVREALQSRELTGDLTVEPNLNYIAEPNPGLELVFSTYEPDHLGVIDYHGAQRTYNGEQLGGINVWTRMGSGSRLRRRATVTESLCTSSPTQKMGEARGMEDMAGLLWMRP